jgi:hypothetical protein
MADVTELERQARELADVETRRKGAADAKAQADAELLGRVLQTVKPVLPLICQRIEGGNGDRLGIELVPGKGESMLYVEGELDEAPLWLVNRYSVRAMLETLVRAIQKQTESRSKAGDKAQRYADKVRLMLAMLKENL